MHVGDNIGWAAGDDLCGMLYLSTPFVTYPTAGPSSSADIYDDLPYPQPCAVLPPAWSADRHRGEKSFTVQSASQLSVHLLHGLVTNTTPYNRHARPPTSDPAIAHRQARMQVKESITISPCPWPMENAPTPLIPTRPLPRTISSLNDSHHPAVTNESILTQHFLPPPDVRS
jgi:hypothetical protein